MWVLSENLSLFTTANAKKWGTVYENCLGTFEHVEGVQGLESAWEILARSYELKHNNFSFRSFVSDVLLIGHLNNVILSYQLFLLLSEW